MKSPENGNGHPKEKKGPQRMPCCNHRCTGKDVIAVVSQQLILAPNQQARAVPVGLRIQQCAHCKQNLSLDLVQAQRPEVPRIVLAKP